MCVDDDGEGFLRRGCGVATAEGGQCAHALLHAQAHDSAVWLGAWVLRADGIVALRREAHHKIAAACVLAQRSLKRFAYGIGSLIGVADDAVIGLWHVVSVLYHGVSPCSLYSVIAVLLCEFTVTNGRLLVMEACNLRRR